MASPAKVANPGPLGLMGFGVTTLVLSLFNSNLLGSNLGITTALPLALAFGGGAQLLAGMWEFHVGNTFGGTAFTGFGAFWVSFYFLATGGYLDPKAANFIGSQGLAVYLLGWTVFTLVMTLGALRVNGATASLFVLLLATFVFLTLQNFNVLGTGNTTLNNVGGYLGIVTAVNAFYNAAAGILKDLAGKDVLPVFPFGAR
jgi:uncharacterized protein